MGCQGAFRVIAAAFFGESNSGEVQIPDLLGDLWFDLTLDPLVGTLTGYAFIKLGFVHTQKGRQFLSYFLFPFAGQYLCGNGINRVGTDRNSQIVTVAVTDNASFGFHRDIPGSILSRFLG